MLSIPQDTDNGIVTELLRRRDDKESARQAHGVDSDPLQPGGDRTAERLETPAGRSTKQVGGCAGAGVDGAGGSGAEGEGEVNGEKSVKPSKIGGYWGQLCSGAKLYLYWELAPALKRE